MPYRAHTVFFGSGLSLTELTAAGPWSKATWSRLLNGKLEPEPEGIRGQFEEFLREHGITLPRDLWRLDTEGEEPSEPEGVILMRGQYLREDARQAFRLFRSPFDHDAIVDEATGRDRLDDLYLPTSHVFAEQVLVQALTGAGFVALYGEPGSGKSTLLERARRRAADRKPLIVVTPANVERRKMSAAHIASEIIRQLSVERIPRSANLRDHVAADVLRQRYAAGQRVALVIDEAHELPDTTLKDLKRYHEINDRDNYIRLLAVILVGQSELAQRFELEKNHKLREAIIRCKLVHLPCLKTKGDVGRYMQVRFGWVGGRLEDVWEAAAVEELERRLAEHEQQIPVLIGNVATAAMNLAFWRGQPLVTVDEVIDVWSATPAQLREWGLA